MLNSKLANTGTVLGVTVSVPEACCRIFSFSMHKKFPSCQRLDIHLWGDWLIYYNKNDHPTEFMSLPISKSTYTAWFKYNANNLNDEESTTRGITYPDFCEKYTFHVESRPRFWLPGRAGIRSTIGRMYTVSPRDIEKYYCEGKNPTVFFKITFLHGFLSLY